MLEVLAAQVVVEAMLEVAMPATLEPAPVQPRLLAQAPPARLGTAVGVAMLETQDLV